MRGIFSIGKPSFQKSFTNDLAIFFQNHFISSNAPIHVRNVLEESQIYAMDICLHFKQESGGLLPEDWFKHMIAEVYDSMLQLFPIVEERISFEKFLGDIELNIANGHAQNMIDNYYSKFK